MEGTSLFHESMAIQDPILCLGSRAAQKKPNLSFSSSCSLNLEGKKSRRLELLLEDFEAEVGQGLGNENNYPISEKLLPEKSSNYLASECVGLEYAASEKWVLENAVLDINSAKERREKDNFLKKRLGKTNSEITKNPGNNSAEKKVLEKRGRVERQDSFGLGALERMAKMLKFGDIIDNDESDNFFTESFCTESEKVFAEKNDNNINNNSNNNNIFKGEEAAEREIAEWEENGSSTNASGLAFEEKYIMGEEIGRGQFGVVRSCIGTSCGLQYACKTVLKANLTPGEATDGVRTEAKLSSVLGRHPNIVRHVEVLEDDTCIHLIMEKCTAGDLYTLVETHKWLPEELASIIFRKIVEAVAYCHDKNILHRDLKPENILLTQGPDGQVEPKVADFGLARLVGPGGSAGRWVGSVYYMAPEIVANQECSRASDVWSLGTLLYVMLSGFLPFKGSSVSDTVSRICEGQVCMDSGPWKWVSESAKSLVREMMTHDPQKRPKAADVLSHPWLMSASPVIPSPSPQPIVENKISEDKQTIFKPMARRKPTALSIPSGPSIPPLLSPLQSSPLVSSPAHPFLPLLSLLPLVSPNSTSPPSTSPNSTSPNLASPNSTSPNSTTNTRNSCTLTRNTTKPTPLFTQSSVKSRDYATSPYQVPPTPKTAVLLETLRLAAAFAGQKVEKKSKKNCGRSEPDDGSLSTESAALFPAGSEYTPKSPLVARSSPKFKGSPDFKSSPTVKLPAEFKLSEFKPSPKSKSVQNQFSSNQFSPKQNQFSPNQIPQNTVPFRLDHSNSTNSNSKALNPFGLLGLSPRQPMTPNFEYSHQQKSIFARENSKSSSQ